MDFKTFIHETTAKPKRLPWNHRSETIKYGGIKLDITYEPDTEEEGYPNIKSITSEDDITGLIPSNDLDEIQDILVRKLIYKPAEYSGPYPDEMA